MPQSSAHQWPESASESMEQSPAVVEPSASSPAQQLLVVQSPTPTEHAGRSPGNPLHAVPRFPATRGPAKGEQPLSTRKTAPLATEVLSDCHAKALIAI